MRLMLCMSRGPMMQVGMHHATLFFLKLQRKRTRGTPSCHPKQVHSARFALPLQRRHAGPTRGHTLAYSGAHFSEFDIHRSASRSPVTLPYTLAARLALGARALLHLARQRRLHALVLLLLVQQLSAQVRNLRLHVRVAARARRQGLVETQQAE